MTTPEQTALDLLVKRIEGEYPAFETDAPQYQAMRKRRILRWVREFTLGPPLKQNRPGLQWFEDQPTIGTGGMFSSGSTPPHTPDSPLPH